MSLIMEKVSKINGGVNRWEKGAVSSDEVAFIDGIALSGKAAVI